MAKIKKAQLGALVKAGVKAISKSAPKAVKAVVKSAETPLVKPKLSLIDQDAKRALQKSIEKRKNPSKKLSYEDEILRSYQKDGGVTKAKDGNWIQKATASIKKRGTEGKCTPITKPGCTGRAKALAKTFKKMAKSKK